MNVGLILLSWGICGFIFVMGLMGSGIVSIHVEIVDDGKKKESENDEDDSSKS